MIEKEIPELLEDLKDPRFRVRRKAISQLVSKSDSPDPPLVPRFIKALKDEEWTVRVHAAWALGCIGGKSGSPYSHMLMWIKKGETVLYNPNYSSYPRKPIIKNKIDVSSAVPYLIEAVRDENSKVGCIAALALGRINDSSAIAVLIDALKYEEVMAYAAEALAEIAKEGHDVRPAVPALKGLLKHEHLNVRRNAINAIRWIGDASVLPDSIELLKEERWEVRDPARAFIVESGESAVPFLIKALESEGRDLRKAVVGLFDELTESNININSAVPALIKALNDKDWQLRYYVAKALGKIGDKSAVPALIKALEDRKYFVRKASAQALGKIGDKSTVPALIKATKDGSKSVRDSAVYALKRIGDSSTIPVFIKSPLDERDPKKIERKRKPARKGKPPKIRKNTC